MDDWMGLLGKDPGAQGPALLLMWLWMFLSESQSNDHNEMQNNLQEKWKYPKTHKDRVDMKRDVNVAIKFHKSYVYAQLICESKNV